MSVFSLRPKSTFDQIVGGMSVIIILMIASISVAAMFLGLFLWSLKKGQYDDEVSPPVRILFEDKPASSFQDNSVTNQNCK